MLRLLSMSMAVCFCNTAMAAINNKDILNNVITRYESVASSWASTIGDYAAWLFWCLVTISMVWTFGLMALRKADIGEFFAEFLRFTMFTGFFYWLLANAATCGTSVCPAGEGIGPAIINGVAKIGAQASGVSDTVTPSSIVDIGFEIFDKVSDNSSVWKPVDSAIGFIIAGVVLTTLALVAINMLLLLITGWILMYAGIFFLGFGGSRWTSDMAVNYFKTVLGLGVQLMTMVLLVGIGKSFLDEYYNSMDNAIRLNEVAVIMVISITLLVLVNKVPSTVAGIMSGASISNSGIGNFGAGAIVGAASMAASAISGGASNLVGGAQSMYSAFKSAQSNVAAGSDITSRMAGMLGSSGGGSSGNGSSPLGSAMGLSSAVSGGMGGGSSSSATSSRPSGSSDGGGSSGGSSEGGTDAGGASSGGASADSGSAPDGGDGRQMAPDTGTSPQNSGSGSGSGSSATSKLGTASRIALDMGANLAAGMGRMAQARIDKTVGGRLAAEFSNPGSSRATAGLDTRSSSRNFDPAAEVAAYRDSKQEEA